MWAVITIDPTNPDKIYPIKEIYIRCDTSAKFTATPTNTMNAYIRKVSKDETLLSLPFALVVGGITVSSWRMLKISTHDDLANDIVFDFEGDRKVYGFNIGQTGETSSQTYYSAVVKYKNQYVLNVYSSSDPDAFNPVHVTTVDDPDDLRHMKVI